ncbi:MAG: histidine kinase [Actinomycetia bacterium]|nr:histidine kinase [Actinomycetes bacterium]
MTDDSLLTQATDWRSQVRLAGPREAPWSLPVVDLVLAAAALVVALDGQSFIARFGPHPAYVTHLALTVVVAAAQLVRKRLLRLSFTVTAAGLAGYSLLTFLSPVNLGLSPLAATALCSLHAVIRWCPQARWRRAALLVAFVGCLVNPVVAELAGRNALWATTTVIALITGTVSALVCAVAVMMVASDAWQRRRLAVERLRVVAQERASAASNERLELARELHDLLGHSLTAIRVRSATALAVGGESVTTQALQDVERTAAASLEEVRDLVRVLRSPDHTGPVVDLQELETVVSQARSAGLELSVEGTPLSEVASLGTSWSALQRLTVLRTVQEGLTNAIRHGTGSARLRLRADQPFRIEVTNPVAGQVRPDQGTGLTGLAERVKLVGGTVQAGPAEPGEKPAFRLLVCLPVRDVTSNDGGPAVAGGRHD